MKRFPSTRLVLLSNEKGGGECEKDVVRRSERTREKKNVKSEEEEEEEDDGVH